MKTNSIFTSLAVHARTITATRHLTFRRAWLWTGLLAFAAIAFGPLPAQAAVTEAWVHRFSNVVSTADRAVKVVRDTAGDIIVTGTTYGGLPGADMLTIKYSGADGSVLWQQCYNSPDQASALAVDGSGNVVVTGSFQRQSGFYDPEIYTAKYAATDGALLWERRGPGIYYSQLYPAKLAVDGEGNVVVTGHSSNTNNFDYYTAKYAAADGALLWEKGYNGPANSDDFAQAVAVDGNGNVVVTGGSQQRESGLTEIYTAKYAAADGVLLWEQRRPDSYDQASAVAVDPSGNVVVMGSEFVGGATYFTAKYAATDGELLWERRDNSLQATAVAVDGSGNVVVTGNSNDHYYTAKYAAADGALLWEKRDKGGGTAVAVDDSDNVVVTGNSNGDYYTAKYAAADGALLWEKRYNGSANGYDSANAVAVDDSGNVVVTGQTDAAAGLAVLGGDYYTAKYAATDGALLWEQRYIGSAPNDAAAQAVAVDGSGNVAVTGVAYNWGGFQISDGDYYTAKYAAANGALLWEKRYNGPANGHDQPSALAVDGSGNVVVTGYSDNGTNSYWDYYTAKYAAADGALLWEKRYNGPANSIDRPYAVAVDGSGNIVVTGQSSGTNSNDHYYTAKYAAADGALLWEKRDKGGGTAVAVDESGNVVVTGYSHNGSIYSDYYTAKYAAADGTLLWERHYNGPANHDDYATAVAVDGNGNVVVTGNSNGDYHTSKYAAADGAFLWEKRYNGPGNFSSDQASAVAVDGSGNVVVTGNSNGDYYTSKYAAVDGALLWEKRYDGPANHDDYATAVAVDARGNAVVTGSSYSSEDYGSGDYYIAMYAAMDGTLLWEKRFNGPASIFDLSPDLALGPDGMVAVAGSSKGGYATVVYREVPTVSIDLVFTGARLRITGLPGRIYNLERAPAVIGPWSTINTQSAPASGLFEYLDTNPPAAAAFYRTREP